MSYGVAAALQAAIHARLTGWPALAGVAVQDAVPAGGAGETWIQIGAEEVLDASDKTARGAEHRLTVSVISTAAGFLAAKTVAGAVTDALADADLALARGHLVALRFRRAVAARVEDGAERRIDLVFAARVDD
ncbi:MAG: DUF3168 domain-containing protein [Rhodobacterales bacterium]|nr:DUF3168 domain-containing protein [Rhodobacterales bacterium]